ncbi:class I SAM-dependent methyltransferase [Desulfoluna sp.]|uniref:class I SAM-dependent methyltransferase n=1 Tax=Desulfoluna sp. TaxID=2045199 RepID=UPI00261FFFB6|nr:class I SAM-dependent methyltransferase [Desulfoluna sp.]
MDTPLIVEEESCCPLCHGNDVHSFFTDRKRAYLRCGHCQLVFVPRRYWLSAQDERATYDLHENNPDDPGYRRFLSRLATPLLETLEPHQKGLDFGCGPGPALSVLLEEQGLHMDLYDPFYHDDSSVFSKTYDVITATEVVEHLHAPHREFTTLFNLLRKGGTLALMTKLVIDQTAFQKWHYIHDPTHICFYSRSTFEYLAQRFHAGLRFVANDVIFLEKK